MTLINLSNVIPRTSFTFPKTQSPHIRKFVGVDREKGAMATLGLGCENVCIMGAGTKEYPLSQDEEESWELWCCNALWRLGVDDHGRWRADRWFEMHPWSVQTTQEKLWLQTSPVNVYVPRENIREYISPVKLHIDQDENYVPLDRSYSQVMKMYLYYPYSQILSMGHAVAFSSTFAYQVALAIYLGFKRIRLVGVALQQGREALVERPNLLYWLGIAEGRGIKLEIEESMLLEEQYLYGYDYVNEKKDVEEYCRCVFPSIARDGYRGSL